MTHSRRELLTLAAMAPLALAAAGRAGAQAPAPACFDPDALSMSQKSRRRSVSYQDPSGDAARRCGKCAFFTASQPAGCGTCAILAGPVAATGVCVSFSARPGG